MKGRSIVAVLCLIGLIWSASPAAAATVSPGGQKPTAPGLSSQARSASRAHPQLNDEATGTSMSLTRLRSGALRVDLKNGGLELRKTLFPNGDLEVALRADGDVFTIIRNGDVLSVGHNDRSVNLGTSSFGEPELDELQRVMAGSTAIRRFRALKSMLAPASRRSALGVTIGVIDILISVLKGETPTPGPASTAPTTTAMSTMEAGDEFGGPTCYEKYEAEVNKSWKEYEECIYSFRWYNPMREVCAFVWVLKAESAWFQFLACSSIPVKIE